MSDAREMPLASTSGMNHAKEELILCLKQQQQTSSSYPRERVILADRGQWDPEAETLADKLREVGKTTLPSSTLPFL